MDLNFPSDGHQDHNAHELFQEILTMNNGGHQLCPNFWSGVFVPMMRQEFRKIRASAGHALTTSLATAVVISLFVYIFGDFFKAKLPEINQEFASRALSHFETLTLIVASFGISSQIAKKLRDPENWLGLLAFWGVSPAIISKHRMLLATIINFILMVVIAALLNHFLGTLSWWQWALTIALTLMSVQSSKSSKTQSIRETDVSRPSGHDFSQQPLIAWRKGRISSRAWNGSSLRVVAAIPMMLGTIALLLGQRIEVAYLSSLTGGILLSWTVPFLIDDDLQTTWIERQAAVSHEDWMKAWQSIFTRWALRMFLVTLIAYTITLVVASYLHNPESHSLTSMASSILINGILAAFPVWLAPAFIMQIDGRKPVTNIIMLTLIGIFAGSVILAAPVATPIIWLLHREAHRYQGGRFARGAYN